MQKKCTLDSSSSFITALDWSENSDSIMTNDASYEILYYNVESKKQDPSGATNFRDEPWATYTCMLGWPAQGIWEPGLDGTDINSVDRSNTDHDGY